MVQEYKNVGIIGCGASGAICAYLLLKAGCDVTIFDYGAPLRTLLPTGGGRCNLAHAEYDFKELAKNYPRGEKFLYSVFSKFSTYDTLALFDELGVETYAQDDERIFPISNSAKDVRSVILDKIKSANFVKEKVESINGLKIKTEKAEYLFTDIVVAIGGKGCIKGLNHTVVEKKPSLVGLNGNVKDLSGIVLKDVYSKNCDISGDILFTHFGISGPLVYKISALKAYEKFPYELYFDLYPHDFDLQELMNQNPHKEMKNILSKIFPMNFVKFLLADLAEVKAHKIDGKIRDMVLDKIHNFSVQITSANKGEETVTAGGFCLDEINSKTMESKIHPHVYFTGECLDIDGFCGGFNLQNAWSTAYVAASAIAE